MREINNSFTPKFLKKYGLKRKHKNVEKKRKKKKEIIPFLNEFLFKQSGLFAWYIYIYIYTHIHTPFKKKRWTKI